MTAYRVQRGQRRWRGRVWRVRRRAWKEGWGRKERRNGQSSIRGRTGCARSHRFPPPSPASPKRPPLKLCFEYLSMQKTGDLRMLGAWTWERNFKQADFYIGRKENCGSYGKGREEGGKTGEDPRKESSMKLRLWRCGWLTWALLARTLIVCISLRRWRDLSASGSLSPAGDLWGSSVIHRGSLD